MRAGKEYEMWECDLFEVEGGVCIVGMWFIEGREIICVVGTWFLGGRKSMYRGNVVC